MVINNLRKTFFIYLLSNTNRQHYLPGHNLSPPQPRWNAPGGSSNMNLSQDYCSSILRSSLTQSCKILSHFDNINTHPNILKVCKNSNFSPKCRFTIIHDFTALWEIENDVCMDIQSQSSGILRKKDFFLILKERHLNFRL